MSTGRIASVRNLVSRLFLNRTGGARCLIQLGGLTSDASRSGTQKNPQIAAAVLAAGNGRALAEFKADRQSYESIVVLANYCQDFR